MSKESRIERLIWALDQEVEEHLLVATLVDPSEGDETDVSLGGADFVPDDVLRGNPFVAVWVITNHTDRAVFEMEYRVGGDEWVIDTHVPQGRVAVYQWYQTDPMQLREHRHLDGEEVDEILELEVCEGSPAKQIAMHIHNQGDSDE